jgi:DNA (cytosine-5)-methyltransferase 1
MKVIVLEHHPNDSRIKIADDGICQALTSRMGTGGGNVPLVIVIDDDGKREETEWKKKT